MSLKLGQNQARWRLRSRRTADVGENDRCPGDAGTEARKALFTLRRPACIGYPQKAKRIALQTSAWGGVILKKVAIELTRCDTLLPEAPRAEAASATYKNYEVESEHLAKLPAQVETLEELSKENELTPVQIQMTDQEKMGFLYNEMDEEQRQRFRCYQKSGLNFNTVMQRISGHPVDAIAAWVVCDLVKEYIEDILNEALNYQQYFGETGPLSTIALVAAAFHLKLQDQAETEPENVKH